MAFGISQHLLQQRLAVHSIDGWLAYDFRGSNRMALTLLKVPMTSSLTRRVFYFVPRDGDPVKIVHFADEETLQHVMGKTVIYSNWEELQQQIGLLLRPGQVIAMEYWPTADLPSQSVVDASTKEWIESFRVKVVSSWPVLSPYVATLSSSQKAAHRRAVAILEKATGAAWDLLRERLKTGRSVTELQLQKLMLDVFEEEKAVCDHPPVVAAGPNTAVAHHSSRDEEILPDSLVLIDAWCKLLDPCAPYADLTHMAFAGKKAPEVMTGTYEIVRQAQETALEYISTCFTEKCSIAGAEVDRACRSVVESHQLGSYFCHRTGHNIYISVHGPAANLDSFESLDTRTLEPNHCYSVEPGIYFPGQFGMRLECNVLLEPHKVVVSGKAPQKLLHLL